MSAKTQASYGASFALSEVTAQNSRAYAFQIGAGTVSLIVNLIQTSFYPTGTGGWFTPTETYGNAGLAPSSDPRLATTQFPGGSTVQFYINTVGELENRIVESPIGILRGVSSITQYPV